MNTTEFEQVCKLLKDRSGIVITSDKAYLLDNRLQPVARKWGHADIDSLIKVLLSRSDDRLVKDVVDAMTTNESLFFRDMKPFDQLRDVLLPKLMAERAATRRIRIWSAACSSGQEPYSIAMLLKELGPKVAGWKFEIMATDLSAEIVNKAKAGLYSQFEVQRGLPITHLVKYFVQEADRWRISDDLRRMVTFREFNLMDHPRSLGKFDVVFCRNVLIYFDPPTKAAVLANIADQLEPDGALYLGGAETVLGVTDRFEPAPQHRGVYHPRAKQQMRAAV